MDFTQEYNRTSWLNFLDNTFLPDDFRITEEAVPYQKEFSKKVTKLGECPSLQLTVFEMSHASVNDARVGLSKEAFTLVRDYTKYNRALALFVPQTSNETYRFSYVEFTPVLDETGKIQRKINNPRRYSFILGKDAKIKTPQQYLIQKGIVKDSTDLKKRFSVEVLTKEFYESLFHWYDEWAIKEVKFPNGSGRDVNLEKGEQNRIHLIRLLTRFIFVWFIKQKNLVPEWIFDKVEIENILNNFKSDSLDEGNYYNGIIQNLFFATLNKPINEREFAFEEEGKRKEDYQIKTKFRDTVNESMFSFDKKEFISLFVSIPFLNGGLFECLDNFDTKEYIDGFSREKKRRAFVPNALFWGKDGKTGLIELFNTYNFTIEENTPQDIDVALDPELLGKVFENLLGTFNEETKKTARNESGSFYTPREIVDYMVDASLKEYILSDLEESSHNKVDSLLSYSDNIPDLTTQERQIIIEKIHDCKILDPACGSGAFPMGVLNKLTIILEKLDPDNEQWKEMQRRKAIHDTEAAFKIGKKQERDDRLKEISDIFEMNSGNYGRKLFLIENGIYGVDIQPIAIQISKLRFFISLIVDQKTGGTKENNYNVLPLPNLETKFVAANTLIGVKRLKKGDQGLLMASDIEEKQKELLEIRHKYFNTRKAKEKTELRKQDKALTKELSNLLKKDGFFNAADAAMLASWDPYCQTKPSEFFDPYWMFGINNGFAVVIGNPPYGADIDNFVQIFKKLYPKTSQGFKDIYKYFFDKSLSLLNKNGILSFITPNTFLRQPRYGDLRRLLLEKSIVQLVDLGEHIFEAVVPTAISIISMQKKENVLFADLTKYDNPKSAIQNISFQVIEKRIFENMPNNLFVGNIRKKLCNEYLLDDILEMKDAGFKYQRSNVGMREKGNNDLAGRIFYIGEKQNDNDIPILIGKDINTFYYLHYPEKKLRSNYKELLKLNEGTYYNKKIMSETKKLIWRQTAPYFIGTILKSCIFFGNTIQAGVIKKEFKEKVTYEYLCGLLNSKYLRYLYEQNVKEEGRVFPQVKLEKLKILPVVIVENQQPIITLVNQILSEKKSNPDLDTSDLERKIDCLVYHLYNLIYDDVKVIEPTFPLSKTEYEGISGGDK